MNAYKQMKDRHTKIFNDFLNDVAFFAFGNEQFDEGMKKLGLEPTDTEKICKYCAGGFILKSAVEAERELWKTLDKEHREAIDADPTGENFIFDMFNYELGNHEYCYTYDATSAIEACGLSWQEVKASEKLTHGLNKAIQAQREWDALINA